MASNLLAMASNLLAMASNPKSHGLTVPLEATRDFLQSYDICLPWVPWHVDRSPLHKTFTSQDIRFPGYSWI